MQVECSITFQYLELLIHQMFIECLCARPCGKGVEGGGDENFAFLSICFVFTYLKKEKA